MQVQSLLVTRHCNQACGFCDRVNNDEVDPSLNTLQAGVRAAVEAGATTLRITGGEPSLRGDLVDLVRFASSQGLSELVLETNATRIGPKLARALKDAGLTEACLSFLSADPGRYKQLAGPQADPRKLLRGAKALLEVGLTLCVRLPLARGLPVAAARLGGLWQALPGIDHFVIAPIGHGEVGLQGQSALSPEASAAQLSECVRVAQQLGATLTLSPEQVLAPCLVPVPENAHRLLADQLREEGEPNQAAPECANCAISKVCALDAQQLARARGSLPLTPVSEASAFLRPGRSAGSRLHVKGAEEVEQFFHVDYEFDNVDAADAAGPANGRPTSRIGVIYRCNQVCTFCELADMDVPISDARIQRAIDEAYARGSRRLILTGGEPTLSPSLTEHVAYAAHKGFEEIVLQTNAVLLAKAAKVQALVEAGLTHAQISVHGPDSAVSDRLTAAPGTHQRTLKGTDNLLAAGVQCLFNHLVFLDNCQLLGDFIDLAETRWLDYRQQITLQFHCPRDEFTSREEALAHIPRYSDYAPQLLAAMDRALGLGFQVYDLQDPTGIPALCVLGADEAYLGPILAQKERPRFHAWESEWMTHVEACRSCELKDACMGIPKTYLALHGAGEFHPLARPQLKGPRA